MQKEKSWGIYLMEYCSVIKRGDYCVLWDKNGWSWM